MTAQCEERPAVSIAVLLYGPHEGLEKTLRSILAQEGISYEILLSDDGTPGVTVEGLRAEIAPYCNAPVSIRTNKENMGTVAHCNTLINIARGAYFKLLPTGDTFAHPHALKNLHAFAVQANAPIITACMRFDGGGIRPSVSAAQKWNALTPARQFSLLARANTIAAPTALFRLDALLAAGGFDESYRYMEDWPAWLRTAREGTPLPCLPECVVEYEGGGISHRDGGTLSSRLLRADMLLCYEKEIFPYKKRLRLFDHYCAAYFYDTLQNDGISRRRLRYLPLDAYRTVKRQLTMGN